MKNRTVVVRGIVGVTVGIAFGFANTVSAADGWASQNGNTTGGAGGSTTTVTTLSAFQSAVSGSTPRIVQVSGTINLGSSDFDVGANKTLIGIGANSGFTGDLRLRHVRNVIIQNLKFTNPNSVGDGDGITINYCTNFFITHCTFTQCGDGECDMTHASDFGTVSWCKFLYTSDTGHNFINLIGHSDSNSSEDTGHLRITMHHNWYSTLCKERMPRVRFGKVHVYNNYYGAAGNNYNVGVGNDCQILLQNCYFDAQNNPWKNYSASGHQGLIRFNGNVFVNCSQPTWAPNSTVFVPPYSYTMDAGNNVKSIVTSASTGAGTH